MTSLVSIIIPTYNRNEFFLPIAIRSCLKQSYRNIEVIVVNDAGESARDVCNSFNDNRVKYFSHRKNKGLGATRNTGIEKSTGEYFVFLDSDDRLYTYMVSEMLSFLIENNAKIGYGNCLRGHQRELYKGGYKTFYRDLPYNINYLDNTDLLKIQNINPVNGFMVHKECFDKAGKFDETLKRYEDWDMWLRISEEYDFYHYNKPVCEFTWRTNSTSMSSTPDKLFDTLLPVIYEKTKKMKVKNRDYVEEKQREQLTLRGQL